MNNQKVLNDVASLPPTAQQEVIDFIEFLKLRYGQSMIKKENKISILTNDPFIGMWKNREELKNSTKWVRAVRENEWG